ncbi:MAG: ABC transporter ATP-binding protein [Lachnospiraceae bacterium]|nr:ABC transporter ATP-binding protein [Lachnospiraceae bacterium]
MTDNDLILDVKDLSVSFKCKNGKINVVRNISYQLKRGSVLAIVGESGSGKSVTVKSIMGMLDDNAVIDSGSINFYDRDEQSGEIKSTDILKLKKNQIIREINGKKAAMIFQDPLTVLNPTMTIGNQIIEGIRAHKKISKKEALDKARELLDYVGICDVDKRLKQYPHQLSGGMRQRVVIAIALALDPEILICDEPTTALDVTVQAKIVELIQSIQKERNLSVIYITHDLGVVANIADYVAVMYAGKIVEYGTACEVFLKPANPYTWGLLMSVPDIEYREESLYSIPGNPPDLTVPVVGDAFAIRNEYALDVDYEKEPPEYRLSDTHTVHSWLYDKAAPKISMPDKLAGLIQRMEVA